MEQDYEIQIAKAAEHVFAVMAQRVTPAELALIKDAFALAKEAHAPQRRKSGEPYIIHPVAVATIAAEELKLDASSVCAAFLHDVVEDTPHTIEDIRERFGDDVAFLVDTVTKKKKETYQTSKQVDNYQQLLSSIHYDIRSLMVKIADRLHNMRTLMSMRPDKQMKIAGETDYFYAPLANRLGLFDVKTDLENLSFKFRCELLYNDIERSINEDIAENKERLDAFTDFIEDILHEKGVDCVAEVYYRKPYSIYRKMQASGVDFRHLDNKYYIRITFDEPNCKCDARREKDICLFIYSILTDMFTERPQSFKNQIDMQKENSYQSLNVMLLSAQGVWEDVQICSKRMVETSKLGCMAGVGETGVADWIERFKRILMEIADEEAMDNGDFIERVATTLYYDDVTALTTEGRSYILPKGATAIDFAFEQDEQIGLHAKYARINGKLSSLKTPLKQGDCVEIGTDDNAHPKADWIDHCCSYKAKHALNAFSNDRLRRPFQICPHCQPLPGGESIGYRDSYGHLTIHRRSCPEVIRLASKEGDNIEAVDFSESPDIVYPVTISIKAIDRYHLLIDIVRCISDELHLSIDQLHTETRDSIADCTVTFLVHSVGELVRSMQQLYQVEGIDEVKQI